jgi:glucose-1-phosphate adenylyltransferase
MAPPRILAFVMAGGEGTRLRPFTLEQPKPALPFADGWRIIDFVLSNLYNSMIRQVFVLLQYKPDALVEHLDSQWASAPLEDGEFIEPVLPGGRIAGREFKGTAHAVHECLQLLDECGPDMVAVFAADHVYRMDVRQMAAFHTDRRADATVAALPVPIGRAREFGVVCADGDARITGFQEKPVNPAPMTEDPDRAFASMGNYLFDPDVLRSALRAATQRGEHDFGRHVLPHLIGTHRVYAYDFMRNEVPGVEPDEERGYWRDVGTVDAYLAAHRDLVGPAPRFRIDNPAWPIRSGSTGREAVPDDAIFGDAVETARGRFAAQGRSARRDTRPGDIARGLAASPSLPASAPR